MLASGLLVVACHTPEPPIVPDAPPVLTAVTLLPAAPRVGAELLADVAVDAPADAALRFAATWTVDGQVVADDAGLSLTPSLRKGQQVGVTVRAWADGVATEPVTAVPVTVVNTPPVPIGAAVTPDPRAWLTPIVCTPQGANDADGDDVTWSMTWTVNGAPYTGPTADATWPGDTVPADQLREGQTWTCTATADDGEAATALDPVRTVVSVGVPAVTGRPVAGISFSCVLGDDLEIVCWGEDGEDRKASPPAGPFVRVYAGGQFACGLRSDDLRLDCWGDPSNGAVDAPDEVVVDAALGLDHGCALRPDGTIACWGHDDAGQAAPPPGVFRAVFAGYQHSCALDAMGVVTCWGAGFSDAVRRPEGVAFVQLAIGGDHACGLSGDGTVRCWGANVHGQASPPVYAGRYLAIGARVGGTCALRDDGVVDCWGDGDATVDVGATSLAMKLGLHACGRLPSGRLTCVRAIDDGRRGSFGEDRPPYERYVAFSAGRGLACGLDAQGRPSCIGASAEVDLPTGRFNSLAVGSDIACALRTADDRAVCWGSTGTTGVDAPPDEPLVEIEVGRDQACGLRLDRTPLCWGVYAMTPPDEPLHDLVGGDRYACGLGDDGAVVCWGRDDNRTRPPEGVYVELDGDVDHVCARRDDGSVTCWGVSGPPDDQAGPFTTISVAQGNACGLSTSGQLRCWGRNAFGIVAPPPSLPLVSLDGGGDRQCGLDAQGGVWCWGSMRRQPL